MRMTTWKKRLTRDSGDTEDLRKLMLRRLLGQVAQREGDTSLQEADDDAQSPFVLQIPDFAPRQSDTTARQRLDQSMEQPISLLDEGGIDDEVILQSAPHTSPGVVQLPTKSPIVRKARKPRVLQTSRFGIAYPNIPPRVTKNIANAFARNVTQKKTRLGKETISAIRQAGDQFLAQLGGDLSTFARHAGRMNLEEADVIAAMMR